MSRADELFGGEEVPRPRSRQVGLWAGAALVGFALGSVCTVLPGLGASLAAWYVASADEERLANGYLAESWKPQVGFARVATTVLVALGCGAVIVQLTVLSKTDLYDAIVSEAATVVLRWRGLVSDDPAAGAGSVP